MQTHVSQNGAAIGTAFWETSKVGICQYGLRPLPHHERIIHLWVQLSKNVTDTNRKLGSLNFSLLKMESLNVQ